MNTLMTNIGVTVTAIFVLTMGYSFVHSNLNRIGIVEYKINSPIQKIGMLMSALNSVANPFVYVLLGPVVGIRLIFVGTKSLRPDWQV